MLHLLSHLNVSAIGNWWARSKNVPYVCIESLQVIFPDYIVHQKVSQLFIRFRVFRCLFSNTYCSVLWPHVHSEFLYMHINDATAKNIASVVSEALPLCNVANFITAGRLYALYKIIIHMLYSPMPLMKLWCSDMLPKLKKHFFIVLKCGWKSLWNLIWLSFAQIFWT